MPALLHPNVHLWQSIGMDNGSGQGWTLTEAAERLGLSREALRKRVIRGRIPAYKDKNGVWLVDLPTLDKGTDNVRDMAADRGGRTSPDTLSVPSPNLTAIMDQWITPLVERVEVQAVRIGHLENENQHLQTEIERLNYALSDTQDIPNGPVVVMRPPVVTDEVQEKIGLLIEHPGFFDHAVQTWKQGNGKARTLFALRLFVLFGVYIALGILTLRLIPPTTRGWVVRMVVLWGFGYSWGRLFGIWILYPDIWRVYKAVRPQKRRSEAILRSSNDLLLFSAALAALLGTAAASRAGSVALGLWLAAVLVLVLMAALIGFRMRKE